MIIFYDHMLFVDIHHHVLGMLKSDEILVRVWILKIASARIGASDNLFTFISVNSSSFYFGGIELVTIT